MAGLWQRFVGFALGLDEAANALGGGSPKESISGTVGRACGEAGGKPYWWGPPACAAIEIMPWFGKGHCARAAASEGTARADAYNGEPPY